MYRRNGTAAKKRKRFPALALSALLAVGVLPVMACNGDSPQAPPPIAAIEPEGQLEFSCGVNCSFEGEATNQGSGCADTVRGVTRLLDSNGDEIDREDWNLAPMRQIRPNETFLYQDCCFSVTEVNSMSSYETDVFWNNTTCQ